VTSLSDLLATAFAHHQRGELPHAVALYRQIVAADPQHADAWHLLGVAEHQSGRNAQAVPAILRAIAINDGRADYLNHLGTAYAGLGELDKAEASFRRALALCETDGDTHYNLAVLFSKQGDASAAIEHYRRAVALCPQMAHAHYNLGNLLRDREEWAEAEASYAAAVAARPGYVKALATLASVQAKQWKTEEAEATWRAVLKLREQALARNPSDVEALVGLGAAQQALGQIDAAKDCYRRALAVQPADLRATFNLGSALLTEGNYPEAERYFRAIAASSPDVADAHFRLGQCLQFEGRFDEAIVCYDRAIDLRPADSEYHYYRATTRLASGDLAGGWPEYEWRLKTRFAGPSYPQPRWRGEELAGDGIVAYAEWGLGDTIQFVRYLPTIEARGGNVTLAVQPSLIPLLAASGYEQLTAWRSDPLPQCRWQVPLLSLPGIFGTTLDSIPADVPYLAASAAHVDKWRARIAGLSGVKVGIHWYGSKTWATDLRSIPLAEFEPLARVGGVTLVSLQENDAKDQWAAHGPRLGIVDFGDELDATGGAFMDTAAVMKHLDLVITCDTSIAHVAGALGIPVWVALPRSSEWRWMWGRADTPWYPTMRLFRQPRFDAWPAVFEQMSEELTRLANERAR
jgi:tetratricopeptide (TPR) repeat protein